MSKNDEEAPNEASEGDGLSECIICFTPYDTVFHLPKVLSCSHVFCLECLSRITVGSTQPDVLSCPICRLPTSVPPKKGPPGLSTNEELLGKVSKPSSCPVPSLRFSRKRGLLYVHKNNSLHLSTVSLSVDLGRPPPDPRSPRNLCSLLRTGGCIFYGSIAMAILLTIALVLAGVYIFYLVPWNISSNAGGVPSGNGGNNGTGSMLNTTTNHMGH
ncbi:RING finger protein 225 [Spea bombifrons]|uniref:RING finger protein 225 n=1 Tax=Spea bombifrons TaxID=233779 RepID=UPI002349220B|nr:RING finger protein 225 [Spea bombifrons]